ncbi:hypothetical protein F0562_031142 [Nyssa sinensis]|uniref:Uncharacterized protein n=1 Tax=Nyssa sinensis TaxID=561372 RepID=A0A5J5AT28_9ASTE|nr:hypothetical protein F0562_031142 [Nyssa sinensis]
MRSSNFVSVMVDSKSRRSCLCSLFPAASLLCLVFFILSAFLTQDHKETLFRWGLEASMKDLKFNKCKNQCRPPGCESLPEGIVSKTSNLEMRPLWGSPKKIDYSSTNLFSVAVGIRQKQLVDKMVRKFLSSDFVVMLFHYDGTVDEWKDLEWSDHVIHVSAANQTKWYISIVKDEKLEISQPALDIGKSEVHHQITARGRRSNVHRRTYKSGDHGIECDGNSKTPPCTGWIEVMAPVFSRDAWRCVWHMIQNDLIHAWGLDIQLGYCAQGDRTKNIGVVDSEYIVHYGLPTLGEPENKTSSEAHEIDHRIKASSKAHEIDRRIEVRRQSYYEFKVFKERWKKAAEEDKCWIDPYPDPLKSNV